MSCSFRRRRLTPSRRDRLCRFNSLLKLVEPRTEPVPTAIGGYELVLRRPPKDAAKIAAEAKATGVAAASMAIGTVFCICGAILAGTITWRLMGRPDSSSFFSQRRDKWQERAKTIDEGSVGQAVRVIGQTASVAIPEHEGLQNLASGLKKQFNPEGARGALSGGVGEPTSSGS